MITLLGGYDAFVGFESACVFNEIWAANVLIIINWLMSRSSFAALTPSVKSALGNENNGAFYAEIKANLRP